MRYAATEELEIIRLVEQSPLAVRRTLIQLGISRATFYRWYQRYRARGEVGLADDQPAPRRVWNKLPEAVRPQSSRWLYKSRIVAARAGHGIP
jgi:transposase-like protein